MKKKRWRKITSYTILGLLALPIILFLYLVISPSHMVMVVKSGSMQPTFRAGDVVVLKKYKGGELSPGTIIAFDQDGRIVTHRAISINPAAITTKGDANNEADQRQLQKSQVKGTYSFKVPYLGYISNFLKSKRGGLVIIIFSLLFLISIAISWWQISRKPDKGGDKEAQPGNGGVGKRTREPKQYWV